MAKKPETKVKETAVTTAGEKGNGDEGQGGEEATIYILKYLFEPTRKQLMGLTNIPLAQVNNLAWMAVFDVATEQMCEYMDYTQMKKLFEKDKEAYLKKVQSRVEAKGLVFNREHFEEFIQDPPMFLSLSGVWSEMYSWLRRSIDGSGVMTASTLAMKQLEMQELGGEMEEPTKW